MRYYAIIYMFFCLTATATECSKAEQFQTLKKQVQSYTPSAPAQGVASQQNTSMSKNGANMNAGAAAAAKCVSELTSLEARLKQLKSELENNSEECQEEIQQSKKLQTDLQSKKNQCSAAGSTAAGKGSQSLSNSSKIGGLNPKLQQSPTSGSSSGSPSDGSPSGGSPSGGSPSGGSPSGGSPSGSGQGSQNQQQNTLTPQQQLDQKMRINNCIQNQETLLQAYQQNCKVQFPADPANPNSTNQQQQDACIQDQIYVFQPQIAQCNSTP